MASKADLRVKSGVSRAGSATSRVGTAKSRPGTAKAPESVASSTLTLNSTMNSQACLQGENEEEKEKKSIIKRCFQGKLIKNVFFLNILILSHYFKEYGQHDLLEIQLKMKVY